MKQPLIIKASGEAEPFDPRKAQTSYRRAGASPALAQETIAKIGRKIKHGMRTDDIYNQTLSYLADTEPHIAARYSLKRAIMNLGPAGYIFEKFVARLLEADGYLTTVSQQVKGRCVTQEVDVTARKGDQKIMVECKYHNRPGLKSDLKVALYTQARFQDVQESGGFTDAWLVTNTHSTTEASKYARCMGMQLIAWRYPYKGGLETRIEEHHLYPITILPSIPSMALTAFANAGIILATDLNHFSATDLTRLFNLSSKVAQRILSDLNRFAPQRSPNAAPIRR